MDCDLIGKGNVGLILDLPFSLVADTLLLPCDLTGPRRPPRDPLQGWRFLGRLDELRTPSKRSRLYQPDEAILDDVQKYVRTRKFPNAPSDAEITFWEDITTGRRTGQQAVRIVVSNDGKQIHHILIYDTSNRRTKRIKVKPSSSPPIHF